jgi:hypothetical protein
MNASELVANLQGMGYRLTLDGGNIRFKYAGAGDPPQEAAVLLEQMKERKAEVLDYLLLLRTPQSELKNPLLIESSFLESTFYLVADENQARDIEQPGGVCYLPEEIGMLLDKFNRMGERDFRNHLDKIQNLKRTFPGARLKA